MKQEELKPCPFCGGVDSACEFKQRGNNHIYCCDCWCKTADFVIMEKAINAWNRRVK
jgi:Lar family restriction alleviation protein